MARPWMLYEKLLAESQQPNTGNSRNRRRQIATQGKKQVVRLDTESDDGVFDGDEWPAIYLTKRKLLREFAPTKDIPIATIRNLIKRKKLQPIRFPNYRWEKYSVRQLQILIKNYNKIF